MEDNDQSQPDWWQAQHLIEKRQACENHFLENKQNVVEPFKRVLKDNLGELYNE